jgi:solute carrier family 25 protein 44
MYSGLTVLLHPLTVLKIRRQTGSIIENAGTNNLRQYYRGLGVVLSMAIPARILYISTLEYTRESAEHIATNLILNPPPYFPISQNQLELFLPLVTPFSGGLAGGLAALSSQLIVVPMDVISQKQMVSENPISAKDVTRTIISSDGYRGLFRGFGLSLFTSLPAGSIWWATYAGAKDQLSKMNLGFGIETESALPIFETANAGTIQVASAFSAAIAAAVVTQPLDTIKTRLQVLGPTSGTSFVSITKELASTGKLYQGLLPRIAHMGIWGSVLSSAYEYLKVVSRKDA